MIWLYRPNTASGPPKKHFTRGSPIFTSNQRELPLSPPFCSSLTCECYSMPAVYFLPWPPCPALRAHGGCISQKENTKAKSARAEQEGGRCERSHLQMNKMKLFSENAVLVNEPHRHFTPWPPLRDRDFRELVFQATKPSLGEGVKKPRSYQRF